MRRGFTLIELLVVIAIIGVLASVVLSAVGGAKLKSQDVDRIFSLRSFKTGLEAYYIENGNYPVIDELGYAGFSYAEKNNLTGACDVPLSSRLHFGNSTSSGFLSELYPEYVTVNDWTDPKNPGSSNNIYNCRYVIPCNDVSPGGPCIEAPQYYLLHCRLDKNDNLQKNDGGGADNLYEITGGSKQLCVTGTP